MVANVPPREASDRLVIFQNRFDTLYRKFITYTGGEELFGLPVSEYPELLQIKKELSLLQKLYGLYNDVIDTVNGYYDILWSEVDIEKINLELSEFQNRCLSILLYYYFHLKKSCKFLIIINICPQRCRKLPRALKEWQAFEDLRKTIDDFNEMVPLLELMANKAMKQRHWKRMQEVTQYNLDVESENFTLRNILQAPLLQHKEEIEVCQTSKPSFTSYWNVEVL